MSSPAPFEPIAELLERSLSIKHVYGEPVQHGDTAGVVPGAGRLRIRRRRGAGVPRNADRRTG